MSGNGKTFEIVSADRLKEMSGLEFFRGLAISSMGLELGFV
jgi:hypothetical protein